MYKKILGVYLLVLALGITLSTLIYLNGNWVLSTTNSLVNENLPQFNAISKLRVAIIEQKPILYEYYATTDRNKFLTSYEYTRRQVEAGLHTIHGMDKGKSLMTRIETRNEKINELALQLDHTLNTHPIDWDLARQLLSEVSDTENQIAPDIDALVDLNRHAVKTNGKSADDKTRLMIKMVIGFSAVLFLIAILIGYQVNAYISESMERRLLAKFPERNPNPVMRMTWSGEITYTNPATTELVNSLSLSSPEQLLPENFDILFANLKSRHEEFLRREYVIKDRVLDCFIHMLNDLHACHVYISDITEQKKAEDDLIYQAYHDSVTGLPNRRMFVEELQDFMAYTAPDQLIAVMLLRLDRIKLVLESQGYETSDNLLRSIAKRIENLLCGIRQPGQEARLFRFEGATFGLLLPRINSLDQLILLSEKLQSSMQTGIMANGREFFFTLSMGASTYPADGLEPKDLIKNAEAAVNRVKRTGGSAFQCYTQDMNDKAEHWLFLESALRHALDKQELFLHYQPQVSLEHGNIIGVEALLRWSLDGKFISPAEFIPLAEETGLIIPIGEWVLITACKQAKIWSDKGFDNLIMAVNISAHQFQHPGFKEMLSRVLQQTGLDPGRLELEITESVAMQDAEKTIALLNGIRELGIQLSIDDFGTGYSSLSYLKRFPINKLKVDQSFVRNMSTDRDDASIAKSVVLIGQSLGLKVIAEGVETIEQLMMLQQYGCDEIQGYYFSRPVSNTDLEKLLQAGKRLPSELEAVADSA